MLKCDWIPIHLNSNQSAQVSDYFDSRILEEEKDGQKEMLGFFRGYPIVGKELKLPDNYQSVLVSTDENGMSKKTDLKPVRIWALQPDMLEDAAGFPQIIKAAEILAED